MAQWSFQVRVPACSVDFHELQACDAICVQRCCCQPAAVLPACSWGDGAVGSETACLGACCGSVPNLAQASFIRVGCSNYAELPLLLSLHIRSQPAAVLQETSALLQRLQHPTAAAVAAEYSNIQEMTQFLATVYPELGDPQNMTQQPRGFVAMMQQWCSRSCCCYWKAVPTLNRPHSSIVLCSMASACC
jgi:hypothetical protein